MKHLTLIILVLVVLIGCKKDSIETDIDLSQVIPQIQPYESGNWLPLAIGNNWEYKFESIFFDDLSTDSDTTIYNYSILLSHDTLVNQKVFITDGSDTYWHINDGQYISLAYDEIDASYVEEKFFDENLPVGSSWVNPAHKLWFNDDTLFFFTMYKIIEQIDTFYTENNMWLDVINIVESDRIFKNEIDTVEYTTVWALDSRNLYFARDIGFVHLKNCPPQRIITTDLVNYSLE